MREQADALRALVGRRAHGRDHEIRGEAVRDERLGAVDDPLVTVAHGGRLERREVGAATGLGHGDRGEDLAGRAAREPARLLLVGAQVDEVGHGDVGMDRDARCECCVELAQLLVPHGVEAEVAGVGAAELLGDLEAEEALGTGGEPEVARKRLVLEVLLEVGLDVLGEECGTRGAECLVVLVEDRSLHGSAFVVESREGMRAKRLLSMQALRHAVNQRRPGMTTITARERLHQRCRRGLRRKGLRGHRRRATSPRAPA